MILTLAIMIASIAISVTTFALIWNRFARPIHYRTVGYFENEESARIARNAFDTMIYTITGEGNNEFKEEN